MFNRKLKDKIKALEIWVENISDIQRQILEELGYDLKWVNQNPKPHRIEIYKKKKEKV